MTEHRGFELEDDMDNYEDEVIPNKNFPLLWKVYDHIVAHPKEWSQDLYACRTSSSPCGATFCFAGHAILMARPDVTLNEDEHFVDSLGMILCAEEEGAAVLGLTVDEADALFYTFTKDPQVIRHIIEDWETAGKGQS